MIYQVRRSWIAQESGVTLSATGIYATARDAMRSIDFDRAYGDRIESIAVCRSEPRRTHSDPTPLSEAELRMRANNDQGTPTGRADPQGEVDGGLGAGGAPDAAAAGASAKQTVPGAR
jgi:hypothetical protein